MQTNVITDFWSDYKQFRYCKLQSAVGHTIRKQLNSTNISNKTRVPQICLDYVQKDSDVLNLYTCI